jgi:pyruvate formate-lyase/glycerol dehydratase family glycyl radical enzyme
MVEQLMDITQTKKDVGRIATLRQKILETTPRVCVERARLVTEVYRENEADPIVLRRAKAFAHTLDHMSIYIQEGDLIVGNQASSPQAAPIFPEYSTDWIEKEIDEFPNRTADRFLVDPAVKRELLEDILPYWQGRTLYDRAKATMPEEVWQAQDIGAISGRGNITSGDGHIIVNIPQVLREGLDSFIARAQEGLRQPVNDADSLKSRSFYQAAIITLQAAIRFAARYADLAEELAEKENDPDRRADILTIAETCRQVPGKPARTFQEALQSAWFIHLLTQIESNGHSFSLGRLDQYAFSYFEADLAAGRISEAYALELLQTLWLRLFSVKKIRPWSHTRFGIGYATYQNVTIGGQTKDGHDATNELSFLILKTIQETRLTQPNVSARYHEGTSDEFLAECARTIKLGFGMPAMKNDEIIIPALIEKGVTPEDANDYAIVGCIEASVPGKWGYRNTGMSFLNMVKVFELAYNNGKDPATQIQLHPGQGELADFSNYEELYSAFRDQLDYYTWASVMFDTVGDLALEDMAPDAFCSALVDDCLDRGKTIKEGGSVYDVISGLQSGLANVANGLMALKKLMFEQGVLSAEEIAKALETNFSEKEDEILRHRLLNAPKFGNDVDEVDQIAWQIMDDYLKAVDPYRTTRFGRGPIGCQYAGSTSNISANVPLGQPVCATPDGRKSGEPIAEGVSPVHGTDICGPTSVMRSVAKLQTSKMLAQLLNLRLSPSMLETEVGEQKFIQLLRGFQRLKGWHVQFNMISTETLLDAQRHPENYTDLIVRVAGYSALFVTLDKATQDDIIARTVHVIS